MNAWQQKNDQMITSYAQNFEDVMLWRALGHVPEGIYIDVGAQDPIVDSVSLAFYEHGWRGIHVEPTPRYANALRDHRPGETVIQAAVGDGPPLITFYEIPGTGISTAVPSIANDHRDRGFDIQEINVICVSLASIFEAHDGREIHWLKIDVEGFEPSVLRSWGDCPARPWIVVVESTLPLTQIESHETWEGLLIGYGYQMVYFDGLNRYYVSLLHPELTSAFKTPPNVFDEFSLSGLASAPFHKLLAERVESANKQAEFLAIELEAERVAGAGREQGVSEEAAALRAELDRAGQEYAQLEKTAAEKTELARMKIEALLGAAVQREKDIAESIEAIRARAEEERVHLIRTGSAQATAAEALVQTLAAREQDTARRIAELRETADRRMAEAEHTHRQLFQALQLEHNELKSRSVEAAETTVKSSERLRSEFMQREGLLSENLSRAQGEIQELLHAMLQREQQGAEQISRARNAADQERKDWAEIHRLHLRDLIQDSGERERRMTADLRTVQREVRWLQHACLFQEKEHAKQTEKTRREHEKAQREQEETLKEMVRREADVAAQLLSLQQRADSEHAEQENKLGDLEQAFRLERARLEKSAIDAEEFLQKQISYLGNEKLSSIEALAQLGERDKLIAEYAECQSELSSRIEAEQAISDELRHSLDETKRELELELERKYRSFAWRMGVPVRTIASILSGSKIKESNTTVAPSPVLGSEAPEPSKATVVGRDDDVSNTNLSSQTNMSENKSVVAHINTNQAPGHVYRLKDFLSQDDAAFVHFAYRALLRRDPDSSGYSHFIGRVRSGDSRIGIIRDIRFSDEGNINKVKVKRLNRKIWQLKVASLPVLGTITANFFDLDDDRPSARRLRRIESRLISLAEVQDQRAEALNRSFSTLADRLTALEVRVATPLIVYKTEPAALSMTEPVPFVPPTPAVPARSVTSEAIVWSQENAHDVIRDIARIVARSTEAQMLAERVAR